MTFRLRTKAERNRVNARWFWLQNTGFSPQGLRVKYATFRCHRGRLKQETVTVQPIKGHFKKANGARDIEEDMHSGA